MPVAKGKRSRDCLAAACTLLILCSALLAAGCGSKSGDSPGEAGRGGESKEGMAALVWPTPYQNPGRTGRGSAAGPRSSSLKWTYDGGAQSGSWAVLAADGSVLAGFRGKVVCLSAQEGTVKWEFRTGSETPTTCGVGNGGEIYFSAGSKVYALSSGGEQRWTFDLGSTADEPCAGAGAVYVGSTGGKLVALDEKGEVRWEAQVSGEIRSPSLDRQGNLYCAGSSFTLYAFGPDGNKLWENKAAGGMTLGEGLYEWANTLDTPSIAQDGTIYAGSMTGPLKGDGGMPQMPPGDLAAGKLYAFTPQGELKWSYAYPGGSGGYFSIHSPSIAQDGTLYCGTSLWRVLALNPQGQLLWEYNTGEGQDVCPSVYSPSIGKDGLLYAATTSGKMICIDAGGREQWRYDSGKPWLGTYSSSNNMTPPPLDAEGNLFSVLAEGKVLAWPGAGARPGEGGKPEGQGGSKPEPDKKPPR